ncbi:MAG: hypothetical protein M0Q41_00245 [Bacteroidales bacterium]|nr:hypothetical protein [Bacteroidales bacterium]
MRMRILLMMAVASLFIFSSCSHHLTGTWSVANFKTLKAGEPGVTLSNIGSLTFHKNGTGEKKIQYTLLSSEIEDLSPFQWSLLDEYIIIEGPESDFSRIWIVTTGKSNQQVWKTTDGKAEVKILELKKVK